MPRLETGAIAPSYFVLLLSGACRFSHWLSGLIWRGPSFPKTASDILPRLAPDMLALRLTHSFRPKTHTYLARPRSRQTLLVTVCMCVVAHQTTQVTELSLSCTLDRMPSLASYTIIQCNDCPTTMRSCLGRRGPF